MPDRLFESSELAALYDAFNPRNDRADFRFYLPLVMRARAVLDVGCGTGSLLHWARELGHMGRLCGLDPAPGMIEQARRRKDVEWRLGDLSTCEWRPEFDLVLMTGHAFQVLLTDEEVRSALVAMRSALTDDGRLAFETRNPAAREWEEWHPGAVARAEGPSGAVVTLRREVEQPVAEGLVRFTHTFTSPSWSESRSSRSTLRFLDERSLAALLAEAGLRVEEQYGDWNREPLSASSREIITIARPVGREAGSKKRPVGGAEGDRALGRPAGPARGRGLSPNGRTTRDSAGRGLPGSASPASSPGLRTG